MKHLVRSDGVSQELFIPQVGAVFSADIAVPEHERELRFYSRVLSAGSAPLWRQDLLNNLGLPIIGLGAMNDGYAQLPLQWMPHIQVADVAASVQRALALGGKELMHHKAEDGSSQWAVLADPNGAAFGLVPVISSESLPPAAKTQPEENKAAGRIDWLDLTVPDAAATRNFYREVVQWSVEEVPMEDENGTYVDYKMLGSAGTPVAGICHARGANADLPPVWMIYLPVADLSESLRRVEEEGGKIHKTVRDDEGRWVYAAMEDPVGVWFALVQA